MSYAFTNGQDLAGGGDWSRPVITAQVPLPLGDKSFYRVFNTSAIAAPTAGAPWGNAPVSLFNGGGINNWDVAMFKSFRAAGDKLIFQLRWEMYNVANHPSFYSVDTAARFTPAGDQINTRLGQYLNTREPRQMQVALRLSF